MMIYGIINVYKIYKKLILYSDWLSRGFILELIKSRNITNNFPLKENFC